jgi:hypothetical protein
VGRVVEHAPIGCCAWLLPPPGLYLVRHGATQLTAEDRFSGAVGVELSDEGRHQVGGSPSGSCRSILNRASERIRPGTSRA